MDRYMVIKIGECQYLQLKPKYCHHGNLIEKCKVCNTCEHLNIKNKCKWCKLYN